MKKIILVLALMLSASTVLVSCKGDKKETSTEEVSQDKDMAMNNVYQCPMDCEDGKTYEEEGKCPVCKMSLKKIEKQDHDNDEAHEEDHD